MIMQRQFYETFRLSCRFSVHRHIANVTWTDLTAPSFLRLAVYFSPNVQGKCGWKWNKYKMAEPPMSIEINWSWYLHSQLNLCAMNNYRWVTNQSKNDIKCLNKADTGEINTQRGFLVYYFEFLFHHLSPICTSKIIHLRFLILVFNLSWSIMNA